MKKTIIVIMLLCLGISLAFAQINTFPWTENFEGTFLPDGWTKVVHTSNDITQSSSQNHTSGGTFSARFSSYDFSNDYNQYLFTPAITVNAAFTQLSFWHRKSNSTLDVLEWGISTSTDPASFTWTPVTLSYTSWQQTIVDLSSYVGSTVYVGFHYYGDYLWYVFLDDVSIVAPPSIPEFSITPTTWDFIDVEAGVTASKTFTVANEGGGSLGITSILKTAGDLDYFQITNNTYTDPLVPGDDFTFDVEFTPAAAAAYTVTITITDDQTKATHDLVVTGNGLVRPAGSTCNNPYPVTLPLDDFTGDTALYGDDYSNNWITPSSSYLNGDDMVLQFTLAEESKLVGTLTATTGNWIGMFVVNTCPDPVTPAPVLASATSTGTVANMDSAYLPTGTYYLLISTYPSPQSFQFSLDLQAVPAPVDPAFSINPTAWEFGTVELGTPVSKTFTITNTGGSTLLIDMDDIDIDPATPQFVLTLPAADISLGNGQTADIVVTFTPTGEVLYAADILILDNITGGKAKAERRVPLAGQGLDPTIDTFPHLEGFEAGAIPTGWSLTAGPDADYNWEVVTTDSAHGAAAPYSGDYFARLYVYLASTDYNPYCLVSPPLDLSSGNVVLSYYAWLGADGSPTPLAVEISTDGMATWQLLYSHDLSIASTWFPNVIPLANFISPMAYIRFAGTSNYGYGLCDMGLDEITFYQEENNVPVELSSFTATVTAQNSVQLTWVTQSESQMMGYRVYRSTSSEQNDLAQINLSLIPAANSSDTQSYSITDTEVEIGTTYYYWLEAVDFNSSAYHGPVSVTVQGNVPPVLPEITTLKNAYPNPFHTGTSATIEVGIKAGETGTLTIYNIAGQAVRSYSVGEGYHSLHWNGRDSRGKLCGSGIYFYRLETPSLRQARKLVIVK